MARQAHPDKLKCFDDIQRHLASVGSGDWKPLFERWSHIGEQTIWKWIREAKKTAVVPQAELTTARAKLVQKVKTEVGKHLPAAPSPDYLARTGARGEATIDFVAEIHTLYRDAQMLRAFGIRVEQDAETGLPVEKIKNAQVFDRSIQRRADLLDSAIKAVQEIWDLRRMQDFYQLIIDEIGRADPDTQKRILEGLARLNSQHGMTMDFRV